METVKCDLCDSVEFRKFRTIKRDKLFDVVKCKKCGLVFMNPRPSEKEINDMYNEAYFKGEGFDKNANYIEGLKYKKDWDIISENRIEKIEKYTKKGTMLDVGCGLGEFLDVARKYGWFVVGIEPSKFAAEKARKNFGLDVKNGNLQDAKLPENSVDVITMLEVIEHLPNPLLSLKECQRLLKKGGLLVIQTGNIDSLYAKFKKDRWPYFLSGHLYYFSKNTLSRMLEKSGFKIIYIYNGDEISFLARSKYSWRAAKKTSVYALSNYIKSVIIFLIRKSGAGGMTIYAKKC